MKSYSIDSIRQKFPALQSSDAPIYFDGPGGTQMVENAIHSMTDYITNGMANLHGTFDTSVRTDQLLDETRKAAANLLGAKPKEIAFGPNMTTLAFSIARSIGKMLTNEDEIIVTELDHRANVDPWVTLAKDVGATIKYIPLHVETMTLDMEALDDLITEKTKLVAVGMASNVTGTITNVKEVIRQAKRVSALTIVDAVHAVPHFPIDFTELGADVLLCSGYKFFGPHVGIAAIQEQLFEKLETYKLAPAPSYYPDKLETGTQNHEGIAGLKGAIKFLEDLGKGQTTRERIVDGMKQIDAYEEKLAAKLEEFFRTTPSITLYRADKNVPKTPTFAFTVKDANSREITKWLADHYNMNVADGDFYASIMAEKFDVYNNGGWIRIGLAPYNTIEEIEQFIKAMDNVLINKTLSETT
ncbi:cysteine desulfurase-like protein [Pseudalkalibacillus caeni]|uniref:Cysteine desulfurase-like protein n=1 Tax=Exobacillus caeni TaxID=2574798 RepID=A0A5R9F2T9_9BACL|nr:cysteine desulfurase-like protein [Pseudalkalibacillus caeni]TLS36810.1 cysteine desulfurase-like protein [Pseudalkalibacillus caeni]